MVRFGLENRLIHTLRLGNFSFLFQFRRLDSLLVCGRRQKLGQKLAYHSSRQSPGKLRRARAVSKEFHRRYPLDAKCRGNGRIVIDVDLGEEKLAEMFFCKFFKNRTQDTARTAPG